MVFRLAVLDGVDAEPIVVKFFGIFFFFFQCNSIIGNIISTEGKPFFSLMIAWYALKFLILYLQNIH
jgi:hypothetical protein